MAANPAGAEPWSDRVPPQQTSSADLHGRPAPGILHLRWEHVDFERGLLLLPTSKTRNPLKMADQTKIIPMKRARAARLKTSRSSMHFSAELALLLLSLPVQKFFEKLLERRRRL